MFDPHNLKRELRREVRALLQETPSDPAAGQRLRELFLSRFARLDLKLVVAGTVAMPGEIDPLPLMEALAAKGHRLCLPVVTKENAPLHFRLYRPGDALEGKLKGLREPLPDAPEIMPDVVLCPLLAFDRAGNRLGRGAGHYDVTLAHLRAQKKILAVGLAYAVQEVKSIPAEAHDQRLEAVVTEKEVILP